MDFLMCSFDVRNNIHILAGVGEVINDICSTQQKLKDLDEYLYNDGRGLDYPEYGIWIWMGKLEKSFSGNYYEIEFEGYYLGKGSWRPPTKYELDNFMNCGDPWVDLQCDCACNEKINSDTGIKFKNYPNPECACCHGKGYFLDQIKKD